MCPLELTINAHATKTIWNSRLNAFYRPEFKLSGFQMPGSQVHFDLKTKINCFIYDKLDQLTNSDLWPEYLTIWILGTGLWNIYQNSHVLRYPLYFLNYYFVVFMSPVSPIFHIVLTVNSWSQTCFRTIACSLDLKCLCYLGHFKTHKKRIWKEI